MNTVQIYNQRPIILYRFYNGITRIKDLGPCFGMNRHPRRDTDVILRLSKSTFEDLSFYIGFVKELLVKMVVLDENDFCMIVYGFSSSFF